MKKIDHLSGLLNAGKLSRRNFITAALSVGVALPSALSIVGTVQAATPKKGGKFIAGLGHGSTTDSLDPGSWENDFMISLTQAYNNYLTEIDNRGNLIGELAESWEASPDAKSWRFTLRSGVEFHNGKSLSAEDVVASFNHHRGENTKSAAKAIISGITDIKTDGNALVFNLSSGNADFPYIVSDYHLPILPSVDGKPDWQSGVGTGGYTLAAYDPGVKAVLKRNPNYWKAGRAHFDEVELITIPDVTARNNALITGEIHFMDRCDLKTLHLLSRKKGITVEELSGTGHYSIPMRTNLKPFDDNNVRMALKHGLDRQKILDTILRGHGSLGNDHPIGANQRYHNSDLPQRAYDPDKSKYYLKQAGLSSLDIDLSAADAAFGGAVDAAVLYREHAAKAGININVVREPNDGYWSNVWNNDNAGWCMCYWGGRPTEDWMFSTAYAEAADWNDTSWKHPRFNELLVSARSELDENKRREMYHEMQRLVSDEGGVVIPVFNNYIHAISDKVAHDADMAANWANDGQRYIERWWLA